MQQNAIPAKFQVPFGYAAASSYIRQVPLNQPVAGDGAASLTTGFPPETFTPPESGGFAPDGRDFNGILQPITAWLQWLQAGGAPILYDATFQQLIGGYPYGATVKSATTLGVSYISTADNNTSNPDTGGANWINLNVVGGVLNGTLPNPGLVDGVAAGNVGILGGALTGTLPNPGLAAFPTSFSGQGYIKLPGGLIIQWGNGTVPPSGGTNGVTVNFPIAFPSTILGGAVAANAGASGVPTASFVPVSSSQAQLWSTGAGGGVLIFYIAIGY
jgi:hypothetical protein